MDSPHSSAPTVIAPPVAVVPTLEVNEIFVSLQGEGPSTGLPVVFLRLAGCNLACAWCDTAYAWNFRRHSVEEEVHTLSVAAIADRLATTGRQRLVVTGGEPLLQRETLAALFAILPESMVIEVETNGTILPNGALLDRVAQWNVSPKLENSGVGRRDRTRLAVLRAFVATTRAWLKLVVATDSDLAEVEALVMDTSWPPERVLLMPEAAEREVLAARLPWVAAAAMARGYGVSSRLHIALWGGGRGR